MNKASTKQHTDMRDLIVFLIFMFLTASMESLSARNTPLGTDQTGLPGNPRFEASVDNADKALAGILNAKIKGIIGRTGCGGDDAEYLIVPSIEVDGTERSSGLVRNVTLVKGALTLMAVSRDNTEAIWHSARIPLEATTTGESQPPAILLAERINVNDAVYVRFVRVARRKISEAKTGNTNTVRHEGQDQ